MKTYRITKEKLKSILQSEKTINFLNDSSRLRYTISGTNNIINTY